MDLRRWLVVALCAALGGGDVGKQFEATKRGTRGQDLDEYMVAVGGGYFYCPRGVRGGGGYLGSELFA